MIYRLTGERKIRAAYLFHLRFGAFDRIVCGMAFMMWVPSLKTAYAGANPVRLQSPTQGYTPYANVGGEGT